MVQIETYLLYLRHQKHYSPLTVLAYQKDLEQFASFLENTYGVTDLLLASTVHVRDWIMYLKADESLNSNSINRKLSSLRSFYKFSKRQGHEFDDPMSKIKALKTPKPLPIFFKDSEVESVLDEQTGDDGYAERRNNMIIEMLYDTGIRRAELLSIKDCDFNLFSLTLQVKGKGGKERVIPISEFLKEKVQEYIDFKKSLFPDATYFILTDKGEKAYPQLVYRVVTEYMGKFSTLDKKSPHVLRHTFAGTLLNSGAEINSVKELLGHANLAATQIYTHTTFEQMREIYKNAHPRK